MTRTGLAGTAAIVCAFAVSAAHAQIFYKVGDLLDKGATRVEAADIKALLSGATVIARNSEIRYSSDGKYEGTAWGVGDQPPFQIQGTWTVDDQGRVCGDSTSKYGSRTRCGVYYRLQNTYYAAESTDRDSLAGVREFKR